MDLKIRHITTNNTHTTHRQNFNGRRPTLLSDFEGYDSYFTSSENISHYTKNEHNQLKSIIYKEPIKISDAFFKLATTKDRFIADQMLLRLHTSEQLHNIGTQLLRHSNIADMEVKSLVGMGNFAFAFETMDGKVLKISERNHFPFNRAIADFDLPIEKHGKFGSDNDYHYYIEEKVTQEGIQQEELETLVKKIQDEGYFMRDHLENEVPEWYIKPGEKRIKVSQFGRAKDGKVYLIDPGCAQETELTYRKYFIKIGKKLKQLVK